MKRLIFLLLLLPVLAQAQFAGGRLQDVRVNISIGIFSPGGVGDYQGAVGTLGSTGYTTDDIVVGTIILDETDLYRVDAVAYTVPGSVATIDVTWLQGTVGTIKPPTSGRGMAIQPTTNLGLLLLLENGSSFITEEQEAKALTHNFLVIDSLIGNAGVDTNLGNTDQTIPASTPRFVHGPATSELVIDTVNFTVEDNRQTEILSEQTLIGSDSIYLVVPISGNIFVVAPNTSTSPINAVLALKDPATGRAQWEDGKALNIGADSLTVLDPDGTYEVVNGDTITVWSKPQWYDAGNGAWVYATGPGITYTKSPGVGDFNIPTGSPQIYLEDFKIVGAAADLNSGEILIDINYPAGVSFNQSDVNSIWPVITIQNRTVVLGTDPYQQRPDDAGDSINIFNERWATAGKATIKITGLSGDFGIMGSGM